MKCVLRIDNSIANMANFLRCVAAKALEREAGAGAVDASEVKQFVQSIQSAKTSDDFCVKEHLKDDTSIDINDFEDEFKEGLVLHLDSDILLGVSIDDAAREQDKESKPKRSAFALMMQPKETNFLPQMPVLESMNLQEQVYSRLVAHVSDIKLGYVDESTEKELKTLIHTVRDVLCFVHKHWSRLFRSEPGVLSNENHRQCPLLVLLSSCTRKKA